MSYGVILSEMHVAISYPYKHSFIDQLENQLRFVNIALVHYDKVYQIKTC